jgi:hypothetical protein
MDIMDHKLFKKVGENSKIGNIYTYQGRLTESKGFRNLGHM